MITKKNPGTIYDKERSMSRLVEAVGDIIKTKGYKGLGPTNIAKSAGLDKRLIYLYFGSVENLVETYVKKKDYYVVAANYFNADNLHSGDGAKAVLIDLLTNQLEQFYQDDELQKIVLWQISESSRIMYEVCEERERFGDLFFKLSEPQFEKTDVDIRAVTGLLVAGIYHMVLHAKSTESLFCGIDLNTTAGRERIKRSIVAILTCT